MTTLDIMTDEEVQQATPTEDTAGFGSLATERGHLPLKAMDVKAKVVGLVSHVTLRQTFVNTFDAPIEATYIFPLPDRGAVTSFRMQVNGRIIDGVIKERGQARQEYDAALRAGHRAAITEEERSGVFTVRVGNLMPAEEGTVRLTLTAPLPYADGEATFRFPLVVAPRYIPGSPLAGDNVGDGVAVDTDAVPDASRITPPVLLPGFPNPVRLSLEVDVDPLAMPLSNVRSSLHTVVEDEGARHLRLQPGERLDRDFILRFQLGDDGIGTSLSLQPDSEKQDEGTFALTLVPPLTESRAQQPRDIVFVLDRSGSMAGWKMVAARRATGRMVDTLTDRDRFTVYAFDNVIETPPSFKGEDLVAATDRNRFRAVEFLAKLDARGGTEMARPLQRAADRLSGGYDDRDRILVLVTDGQVGNEDQILHRLAKRNKNVSIFTLGVDRAVNEGFLKRLAALGGGSTEVVESEDRLDEVMDRIHRRIGTPVLTGVTLEAKGLELVGDSIVPGRLPDLFAGSPIVVSGRYRQAATLGDAKLTVKATDAAAAAFTETLTGRATDSTALAVLWARGHIRDLEDRYATGHHELAQRIVDISLRFGVLSRFTAFVAVDRSEKVNQAGGFHRVTQPVEAPAGWEMMDPGDVLAATAAEPMEAMMDLAAPPPAASAAPMRLSVRSRPRPGKLRGALGGLLGGRGKAPEAREVRGEAETLDLSSYRRRAKSLLDKIIDSGASSRALGVLAVELGRLVEDLESVGADDSIITPLRELAAELRNRSGRDDQELWAKAKVVLEAFVESREAAPTPRKEFWK